MTVHRLLGCRGFSRVDEQLCDAHRATTAVTTVITLIAMAETVASRRHPTRTPTVRHPHVPPGGYTSGYAHHAGQATYPKSSGSPVDGRCRARPGLNGRVVTRFGRPPHAPTSDSG